MIKTILLVNRKPGLSQAEFEEYYESRHAPLAASLMATCVRYVRDFPVDLGQGIDADVITEFWFDLDGPWPEAAGRIVDEVRAGILEQDELQFMDRDSMRLVVVRERETALDQLAGNAGHRV